LFRLPYGAPLIGSGIVSILVVLSAVEGSTLREAEREKGGISSENSGEGSPETGPARAETT
jgi:hypothetical protein